MNTTPEAFAQTLRDALKKKFGQNVTAAFLARELDIFSKGEVIVTGEAVRRWLVGISLPRAQVVAVLEAYLGRPLVNDKVRLDVNALDAEQLKELQSQVLLRLNELSARPSSKRP